MGHKKGIHILGKSRGPTKAGILVIIAVHVRKTGRVTEKRQMVAGLAYKVTGGLHNDHGLIA